MKAATMNALAEVRTAQTSMIQQLRDVEKMRNFDVPYYLHNGVETIWQYAITIKLKLKKR